MAITDEDLHAATLAVKRAEANLSAARQARHALIRQALKQGMRGAHVARQTGLSRNAVSRLAKGDL